MSYLNQKKGRPCYGCKWNDQDYYCVWNLLNPGDICDSGNKYKKIDEIKKRDK